MSGTTERDANLDAREFRLVLTSMKKVGSYEAKTHLPRLLDEVSRGERIAITRHGVTIAYLVPATEKPRLRWMNSTRCSSPKERALPRSGRWKSPMPC